MLYDDLDERDAGESGGGRKEQERGDIYLQLWLILVIQQKAMQYCKAIILQLKNTLKIE